MSVQGQIGQDDQAILSQHLKQRRLSELLVCRVDNIHNYTIHTYPCWNQNYAGYMSLVHFIYLDTHKKKHATSNKGHSTLSYRTKKSREIPFSGL